MGGCTFFNKLSGLFHRNKCCLSDITTFKTNGKNKTLVIFVKVFYSIVYSKSKIFGF